MQLSSGRSVASRGGLRPCADLVPWTHEENQLDLQKDPEEPNEQLSPLAIIVKQLSKGAINVAEYHR